MKQSVLLVRGLTVAQARLFSSTARMERELSYKLVVVGGGAGGCGTANKFAGKLGGKDQVAIIEPEDMHYYQPMWTLVGGGLKDLSQSGRDMKSCLPKNATWLKDSVTSFQPDNNKLITASGDVVTYQYLVVALGLQLRYDKIKGLPEAFDTPGVGSNYSVKYVEKTQTAIKNFNGGNAVFTFPNSPIKCAGAPQKIMYIAADTFQKSGTSASIHYYSSLPVLFGVKKYADALWKIVKSRGINVNLRHNLIEVKADTKEAVFEELDTKEIVTVPYDLLHITPPMNTPECLGANTDLADPTGYLSVDKETLQHTKYPNVFGIGDCTNVPTAKTAAAVAGQLNIIRRNLGAALASRPLPAKYDGYTSCPLVTGRNTVVLAEFDFQAPPQPLETFPINQGKPMWIMYQLKAHIMPPLYFHGLIKGWWEGPGLVRRIFHLGLKR